MKKILIFILALTIFLTVSGCTKKEKPFLSYQDKNFEARGTLDIKGEKYSVQLTKNDANYILEFLAPDTIKGVRIEKNSDGIFYKFGSLCFPVSEQTNVSALLPSFFALTQQDLSSTESDTINGTKVQVATFRKDQTEIKIIISKQTELPLRFEADFNGTNIVFNISEFKINM
ncbi:MAG: hypothetical protein IKU45_01460 [Clostridia bacterium]|nr:hypothetical protein [Clostridia bacterium]